MMETLNRINHHAFLCTQGVCKDQLGQRAEWQQLSFGRISNLLPGDALPRLPVGL